MITLKRSGIVAEDGLTPIEKIESIIIKLRGRNVILDADLARLYGVSTKALNQAVKRNEARFPDDFAFIVTAEEKREVVTICDHLEKVKYSNVLPVAFTEHRAIMAASVLNIGIIVEAIRRLIDKPEPSPRQIGFRRDNRDD